MDFGSRLATARKAKGFSQEELAELLGVSRQTIYKWETGITYPDIDKLCDISRRLEVTTVYLLDGDESVSESAQSDEVSAKRSASNDELIKHFSVFSRAIGFSTLLILLGVAVLVGFSVFNTFVMNAVGLSVMLVAIFAAVIGYVISGIKHESFKKEISAAIYFDRAELKKEARQFALKITLGLSLIFIGILGVIIFGLINIDVATTVAVAVMLAFIGVACYFFITGGIMHELYSTPEKAVMTEDEKNKKFSLEEGISGIIMAVATATFLVFGFCFNAWHPAWVAFPIGAILSGCVSSIIKIARGGKDSSDEE